VISDAQLATNFRAFWPSIDRVLKAIRETREERTQFEILNERMELQQAKMDAILVNFRTLLTARVVAQLPPEPPPPRVSRGEESRVPYPTFNS
jgi:hypothetical protein